MNKRVKELWMKALRSGDYVQGIGALCYAQRDGTKKYCCLGVLCELARDEVDLVITRDSDRRLFNGEDAVLPQTVIEWAGLSNPNPIIGVHGHSAADLNDTGGTFREIADLIEANL
jgi:hypothetical protein